MEYQIKTVEVDNKSIINMYVAPGGGFAIEIKEL